MKENPDIHTFFDMFKLKLKLESRLSGLKDISDPLIEKLRSSYLKKAVEIIREANRENPDTIRELLGEELLRECLTCNIDY